MHGWAKVLRENIKLMELLEGKKTCRTEKEVSSFCKGDILKLLLLSLKGQGSVRGTVSLQKNSGGIGTTLKF